MKQKNSNAALFIIFLLIIFPCSRAAQEQYKTITRDALSDIVDGDYDKAIRQLDRYLKRNPNDLESLYGLTIAYARKGDITKSIDYFHKAIDHNLPLERFLAGPRELFKPLYEHPEFKKIYDRSSIELLHGPMVGCVSDSNAAFWVRTVNEVPVKIIISPSKDFKNSNESTQTYTYRHTDYTTIAKVADLKPDTKYYYKIIVNKKEKPDIRSFHTFVPKGQKCIFKVGFGGGAGYTPQHERMWDTINRCNPDAFLLLGDNVYIDNPTRRTVQRYCYYRRQSRKEFRKLISSVPIYAIWDDHDFTTDDGWGGPEINHPSWKKTVWRTYKNNWNNPYYGGGDRHPGCWFDFSIGDVDFFMLDGRYYRTDPKAEKPNMLGELQKQWLFEKIKYSKATFKVIASPVPWSYGTKPGSLDTWEGYKEQREEIFDFLQDNNIDGIILLSADRHRSDIWKIERENTYDLYEFESSRLTNIHKHRPVKGSLFSYHQKCSFGLLKFDTTADDPRIVYDIINIDKKLVNTFKLRKSQLTHK